LSEITYKCDNCKKTITISDESIPECCGKKMSVLPIENCIQPAHAEHARPMEDEDACDEGRSG